MQTPRLFLIGTITALFVVFVALGVTFNLQRQRAEERIALLRQIEQRQTRTPSVTSTEPAPLDPPVEIGGPITEPVTHQADGTIVSKAFTATLPKDWRSEAPSVGLLDLFDASGAAVANVRCPVPDAGYEAWDFTQTDRSYVRDGLTRYATKWIGAPNEHADDLGWLAIIMGGSPEPGLWGTHGCQLMVRVSAPPTKAELDTIDAIYESVR